MKIWRVLALPLLLSGSAPVPGDILTELITIFPTSLYMVRQLLDLDRGNFTKYVICPKCTKCYGYNECFVEVNGQHVVKRCSSKFYSRGKSHTCNAQLVKKVTLKDNVTKYYPIHYYCYAGIINSLEKLVQKSSFPERCEEWRTRGHIEGDLMMFAPLIISGAINYIWRQNKTITTCPSLRKALHHGPNSKESSLTHSHL